MIWLETARLPLFSGDYAQVTALYETVIAQDPTNATHYWYLGLAYLLQGLEEQAQGAWMSGMAEGNLASLEAANEELAGILATEAQRQAAIAQLEIAWLIRLYLRELVPEDEAKLLALVELGLQLGDFEPEKLEEWNICTVLSQSSKIERDRLLRLLDRSLNFPLQRRFSFSKPVLKWG